MKFGEDKSPSTASFIFNPSERDSRPRIAHVTGLGFNEGALIVIERAEHKLIFEAEAEREVKDRSTGFPVPKMEKYKIIKELRMTDIQSIDIVNEESGTEPFGLLTRALVGTKVRYKSYLKIQVKPENGISYPIILGGSNQKEVRTYYEHLIELVR